MATLFLFGMFPFLKTLFADSGCQGPKFAKGLAKVLPHLDIEIVKRSDQVSGFVVLPKRWIVERTIAWLNRCRRLARDWEESQPKSARVLAPRLNPPHAQKTLQSGLKSPERTLRWSGSTWAPSSSRIITRALCFESSLKTSRASPAFAAMIERDPTQTRYAIIEDLAFPERPCSSAKEPSS